MRFWAAATGGVPAPAAGALVGAVGLGVLGGVVGFVVGLLANPGTAWFAVLELGLPAMLVGTWLGLLAGTVVWTVRRVQVGPRPRPR